MNNRKQSIKYLFFDIVAAMLAWAFFFYYRKEVIEGDDFAPNKAFYLGITIIPICWVALYYISGLYYNVLRRYRIKEVGQITLLSLIGTVVLFFSLLLDDEVMSDINNYYKLYFVLLGLHFGFTIFFRLLLTSSTVKKIHNRKIGFNTLIIGGSQKAVELYNEIESLKESPGFIFKGFVSINGIDRVLKEKIEYFGTFDKTNEIIQEHKIEEVIIAIESFEHDEIKKILNLLNGENVKIQIIPDVYDILSGSVKMTSILGSPLIEVNSEIMPPWQQSVKRMIDVGMSIFALIILSPIFLIVAIAVKLSSKGPILFRQERVGIHGSTFNIIKFRTMRTDAEDAGPQLSSDHDPRITKVGKFLRKTRLDEFPQFYNVLIGEMSIVGPRPERQFYIDQIVERAPHYLHLNKLKPGITSWGQVKYGYASNLDEMILRLKYDLLYLENMSLAVDFKIMIYTVRTILKGSGK